MRLLISDCRWLIHCRLLIGEAGDGVVGHDPGDVLRRLWSFGAKPVRRPVEGAEKGPRRHGGVGGAQHPAADPGGDQRAHAALVPIALGDDARAKAWRERIDFEMRGRSFDFVDQTEDVRDGQIAQPGRQRPPIATRGGERLEQPVERSVLAEEEELVLAAKVVIEIAGREAGGDGDVAHAGGGEAARTKHARGGPHDFHAAAVGAH
jgi:hypothetical protein